MQCIHIHASALSSPWPGIKLELLELVTRSRNHRQGQESAAASNTLKSLETRVRVEAKFLSPSSPYSSSSNKNIPSKSFSFQNANTDFVFLLNQRKKQEPAYCPSLRHDALCSSLHSAHIPSLLSALAIYLMYSLFRWHFSGTRATHSHDHRILFQEGLLPLLGVGKKEA